MPVSGVKRAAQVRRQPRCGRPLAGVDGEGLVDQLGERSRQVGPHARERRRAATDLLRDVEELPAAERVAVRERLPEQDAGRPHVGRGLGGLSAQALRRDVRQRPGHVARCGQGLLLGHQGEPEIEQPDGDARTVREQHVRGLDVPVNDPALVRVSEPLQDLRRGLDRALVVELAVVERVTQRAPGDVLVGDVHVPLVARERIRPQASRMLELGGGGRLALRARAGGAGAGDDLQRDFAVPLLVLGVPDRPHSAAAERSERSVAPEHEPVRGRVSRGLRHPPDTFRSRARIPVGFKDLATLARISLQNRHD